MATARTLIVFPASLHGGYWATGPRVKAELVSLHTVLRRTGVEAGVLDLENVVGNPDASDRDTFAASVERRLSNGQSAGMELLVVACSSCLQYTAALAVGEVARRLYPDLPIAVAGFHVTARPDDFTYNGSPFDWVIVGESEMALVELAGGAARNGRPAGPVVLEGTALTLDADTTPDYAAYPYVREGLTLLPVFLSRGCPFPLAACQLRPGSPGWRAYAPELAGEIIAGLAALKPGRIDVLDPSFGLDPGWRTTTLQALARAEEQRRYVPLVIGARPEAFTRADADAAYVAGLHLRLDVGTLSPTLLERTGAAPQPVRHVEHALDLLEYVNAKGLLTDVDFVFNRPGETRETACETLDALETFVERLPNTTLHVGASSWVYSPYADVQSEIEVPRERYGTRILHPEWWHEGIGSERAAKAVVASRELADLEAGDESYWRPRFDALAEKLAGKLTTEARRGVRSHTSVGSAATGVPHGFWVEPRWH